MAELLNKNIGRLLITVSLLAIMMAPVKGTFHKLSSLHSSLGGSGGYNYGAYGHRGGSYGGGYSGGSYGGGFSGGSYGGGYSGGGYGTSGGGGSYGTGYNQDHTTKVIKVLVTPVREHHVSTGYTGYSGGGSTYGNVGQYTPYVATKPSVHYGTSGGTYQPGYSSLGYGTSGHGGYTGGTYQPVTRYGGGHGYNTASNAWC